MKKNYVSLIVVALLVSMSAMTVSATSTYNYDVNGDGKVNAIDVIALKNYIFTGDENINTTSANSIGTTTTRVTTTPYTWTTTTRATTTTENNADEETLNNKYELLAKEYISNKNPNVLNIITSIDVDIIAYRPKETTTVTTNDETLVTTAPIATTTKAATTTLYYGYDTIVTVNLSRVLNDSEKEVSLPAWLYQRKYITIYFRNGSVYQVT